MAMSLLSQLSHTCSSPAFCAAANAMGELGVAGCIGAACVQQGTITPEMVRALSNTIFHVLLPMFIGTAIMKTVVVVVVGIASSKGVSSSNADSLGRSLLAVPILAALQAAIMFVLTSNILIPLLFGMEDKDSDNDAKTLAVTCSFGNAGVLPFVFAEAMFRDQASPLLLQQAYSQVSLFSAGWSPLFWSFVPKVLGISPSSSSSSSSSSISSSSNCSGKHEAIEEKRRVVVMGRFLRQELPVFFPPPVVGVVTGLLVGLSPWSSLLLSSSGDKNNAAPLAFIYNSFQNLGKAANPLAVLVLACSLALGATTVTKQEKVQPSSCATKTTSTTAAGKPSLLQKWACVSLARFVLSPLVMLGLLWIMSSKKFMILNLIPSHRAEPMTWFICLLEAVMPPAQNSVVLLHIAGRPHDAEQMAKFLFYIYATSMIPIVVLVTIALQWLQLLS